MSLLSKYFLPRLLCKQVAPVWLLVYWPNVIGAEQRGSRHCMCSSIIQF